MRRQLAPLGSAGEQLSACASMVCCVHRLKSHMLSLSACYRKRTWRTRLQDMRTRSHGSARGTSCSPWALQQVTRPRLSTSLTTDHVSILTLAFSILQDWAPHGQRPRGHFGIPVTANRPATLLGRGWNSQLREECLRGQARLW